MPSLTQHPPNFSNSKKRTRDDNDHNHDHHERCSPFRSQELREALNNHNDGGLLYFQHSGNRGQQGAAATRKIISLPVAKKLCMTTEWEDADDTLTVQQEHDDTADWHRHHRSPPRHTTRSPSKELLQTSSGNSRPNILSRTTTSIALLSPCHICHRKPTKRSNLDSYAECQGCGEQTCYVCIRECLGWNTGQDVSDDEILKDRSPSTTEEEEETLSASFHMEDAPNGGLDNGDQQQRRTTGSTGSWGQGQGGHRQMVCSRCCVERGPEGEVICLGCLEK